MTCGFRMNLNRGEFQIISFKIRDPENKKSSKCFIQEGRPTDFGAVTVGQRTYAAVTVVLGRRSWQTFERIAGHCRFCMMARGNTGDDAISYMDTCVCSCIAQELCAKLADFGCSKRTGHHSFVIKRKHWFCFVIGISSNLPKTTKQWPPEFMKRHGCVLTRFRSDETLSHTLKGSIPWMAPEAWHGLTISEVTFFTEKGKLVFGFSFHEFIPLDKDMQGWCVNNAIEHFSHVFNSHVHYPSWLILLEISTHFLCMISFNTPITYSHRHTVALTSWRASWSSCKKGNVFVCAL